MIDRGDKELKTRKLLHFSEFGEGVHLEFFEHPYFVFLSDATLVAMAGQSQCGGEELLRACQFGSFKEEASQCFSSVSIGAFFVVEFATKRARLEVIVELVGLFAIEARLGSKLLPCTF